jgi:hypothetical protein
MKSRFQFRLRTLLIGVTVFCIVAGGYFGWQAKKVDERKALLRLVMSNGGGYITTTIKNDVLFPGDDYLPSNFPVLPGDDRNITPLTTFRIHSFCVDQSPSFIRQSLGDVIVFEIFLPESLPTVDVVRIVERFPEAMIFRGLKQGD